MVGILGLQYEIVQCRKSHVPLANVVLLQHFMKTGSLQNISHNRLPMFARGTKIDTCLIQERFGQGMFVEKLCPVLVSNEPWLHFGNFRKSRP